MTSDKKSFALAMLGNTADIENISEPLKSRGIVVSKKNYIAKDELLEAINRNNDVEYVILSDSGMLGIRDGKYTVPYGIASLERNIYIVIFFSMEKRNEKYIKWAAKYGIKSVYYADDPAYTYESGGFDFNKILREITEKRRIYSEDPVLDESDEEPVPRGGQPQIITVEVEKEVEVIREVQVEVEKIVEIEKEVIKEVPVPVEKVIERELIRQVPVPVIFEQPSSVSKNLIKEALQDMLGNQSFDSEVKTSPERITTQEMRRPSSTSRGVSLQKTYVKDVIPDERGNQRVIQKSVETYKGKSHICIGVFNLSPGAGATTTAVDLADAISNHGYSVAVVSYDGKKDLEYAKKNRAVYVIPDKKVHKRDVLIETRMRGYHFVIIDFGSPMDLTPEGDVIRSNIEDLRELSSCQLKICLGFSNSWNIGKVNYFLNNTDGDNNGSYILALQDIGRKRGLERLNVTLCNRISEQIIDKVFHKILFK
jgi:hypothetical protein